MHRYPFRIQGALIDSEISEIVDFLKAQGEPDYLEESCFDDHRDEKQWAWVIQLVLLIISIIFFCHLAHKKKVKVELPKYWVVWHSVANNPQVSEEVVRFALSHDCCVLQYEYGINDRNQPVIPEFEERRCAWVLEHLRFRGQNPRFWRFSRIKKKEGILLILCN